MAENIPLEEQIRCVRRELQIRHQVYPNRVNTGRMTKALAAREIATMEAVLTTLLKLEEGERLV